MHFTKNTSGFTLVEMTIAVTIFAVMSVAVMSIYIQTTSIGQKMRLTRHLSETAREITERIADDVREQGISLSGSIYDDHGSTSPDFWKNPSYTLNGWEILAIGNETSSKKMYVFGSMSGSIPWLTHCTPEKQSDWHTHCWLYVVSEGDMTHPYNLVDSFIPEESKKRVKVEDLKFYISGDGISTEKKVTLVMTLGLMPKQGVSPALAATTKMHIQTTISERFYK